MAAIDAEAQSWGRIPSEYAPKLTVKSEETRIPLPGLHGDRRGMLHTEERLRWFKKRKGKRNPHLYD
jgi:hypothetical protein